MRRKRRLIATYLTRREYPDIVAWMRSEGVWCSLDETGFRWFSGRCALTTTAIREAYGLTQSQYYRFRDWVMAGNMWDYGNDS